MTPKQGYDVVAGSALLWARFADSLWARVKDARVNRPRVDSDMSDARRRLHAGAFQYDAGEISLAEFRRRYRSLGRYS